MKRTAARRWFAVGDPQATHDKFTAVLRHHGLLGEDGYLLPDVGLVAIGDYFDFNTYGRHTLAESSQDGLDILRWLARHPADQAVIIVGNHDTSRVMELAFETDATFAAARELAAACMKEDPPAEKTREFNAKYPHIGPPAIANRDFSAFTVAQRALVQELLLADRMHLAWVGRHAGHDVLFTHAGVTNAELATLGVEPRAADIANALRARLRDAVASVRDAWERGEPAALNLEPLHFAGRAGREGGGFLYHRPSSRGDALGDKAPLAPRRFHPRELPRGVVQVCGHTGHKKSREQLAEWYARGPDARTHGGLRTLSVSDTLIGYREGIHPVGEHDAAVYFIDGEMNSVEVWDVPIFELA